MTQAKRILFSSLKNDPQIKKKVIEAMESISREMFISEELKEIAYENQPLPIECGQTISQPFIVALMTSLLDLKKTDIVLEIGTGSGYQAAILAKLCKHVYTIEYYNELLKKAKQTLYKLGFDNITYYHANGLKNNGSLPDGKIIKFDKIIVTAAAERPPEGLLKALAVAGKMIIPIGRKNEVQDLIEIVKTKKDEYKEKKITDVIFVPFL